MPVVHGEELHGAMAGVAEKLLVRPRGMGHNTNLLLEADTLVHPMFHFFSLPDFRVDDQDVELPEWTLAPPPGLSARFRRERVIRLKTGTSGRLASRADDAAAGPGVAPRDGGECVWSRPDDTDSEDGTGSGAGGDCDVPLSPVLHAAPAPAGLENHGETQRVPPAQALLAQHPHPQAQLHCDPAAGAQGAGPPASQPSMRRQARPCGGDTGEVEDPDARAATRKSRFSSARVGERNRYFATAADTRFVEAGGSA